MNLAVRVFYAFSNSLFNPYLFTSILLYITISGSRRDPLRLREGLHPLRDHLVPGHGEVRQREGGEGVRSHAQRGARLRHAGGRHLPVQIQRIDRCTACDGWFGSDTHVSMRNAEYLLCYEWR